MLCGAACAAVSWAVRTQRSCRRRRRAGRLRPRPTARTWAASSWVFGLGLVLFKFHGYSRSILLIDPLLLVVLLAGVRMSKQLVTVMCRTKGTKRVLIFGAGDAGEIIVRDMQRQSCGYEPVGFLDDSPVKFRQRIHGVPVLGSRHDLARV